MIAGGAALLNHAYWVLYLFAAFLIFTGIRMFFAGDQPMDVANNRAVKFITSHMRITHELHGQHFFVKTQDAVTGKVVTAVRPLFLALVVLNLADLGFEVERVPAIFEMCIDTLNIQSSQTL